MSKNPNLTLSGPDLAALLCSRVCHDIISPVGAINNGLELLDEGGAGAGVSTKQRDCPSLPRRCDLRRIPPLEVIGGDRFHQALIASQDVLGLGPGNTCICFSLIGL